MITPEEILGQYSGGRVLDVATGSGSFIYFLMAGLRDYKEIIGVDLNERSQAAYIQAFHDQPNVGFVYMDATRMMFLDGEFDTVSIANSLHHMANLPGVLAEMLRVLRPGGTFILSEKYQGSQNDAQKTHVELHHWWAAVDRATGIYHAETNERSQLMEIVAGLNLENVQFADITEIADSQESDDIITELNEVISRYQARLEGTPDSENLLELGEGLRTKVKLDGFQHATILVAVGMKPVN